MVEIIVLWILCKRISKVAAANKRNPGDYKMLLVGLWIAGEILGCIVGIVLIGSANIVVYIIALIGAVIGSAIAFKRASRTVGVPYTPDWRTKKPN
jgi:hypothetical protein